MLRDQVLQLHTKTSTWTAYNTYQRRNNTHKLVVEYGFRKLGEQDPYFFITGEHFVSGRMDSCGRLDEDIYKRFKSLRPLLPFNGYWFTDRLPSHFIQNGLFWMYKAADISEWDKRSGDPDPRKVLYDFLQWDETIDGYDLPTLINGYEGLESDDTKKIIRRLVNIEWSKFLNKRGAVLQQRFEDTMQQFGFTL